MPSLVKATLALGSRDLLVARVSKTKSLRLWKLGALAEAQGILHDLQNNLSASDTNEGKIVIAQNNFMEAQKDLD